MGGQMKECETIMRARILQTSYIESDVVDAITESQVASGKPVVVCTVSGEFTQILVKMLEEDQIPSYITPQRARAMHLEERINEVSIEFEENLFNLESSLSNENEKEATKPLFLFRYE